MKYPYEVNHEVSPLRYYKRLMEEKLVKLYGGRLRSVETPVTPVFVVGCGHSGTTVMANRLFQHESVLPISRETNIFHPLRAARSVVEVCSEWSFVAEALGKTALVEKTPKHIHSIDRILKVFPGAKIIYMVRSPSDCVSSMMRRFGSLDFCINRYKIDNDAGLYWVDHSSLKIVHLEVMQSDPQGTLLDVCRFVGLEYHDNMLSSEKNFYAMTARSGLLEERREQMNKRVQVAKISDNRLSNEDLEEVNKKLSSFYDIFGYSR